MSLRSGAGSAAGTCSSGASRRNRRTGRISAVAPLWDIFRHFLRTHVTHGNQLDIRRNIHFYTFNGIIIIIIKNTFNRKYLSDISSPSSKTRPKVLTFNIHAFPSLSYVKLFSRSLKTQIFHSGWHAIHDLTLQRRVMPRCPQITRSGVSRCWEKHVRHNTLERALWSNRCLPGFGSINSR